MTDEPTARAQIARWGDMVWRLALARTRHVQDSEDVFQEVFARFFRHEETLESDEHRKAWLIRCTLNCTNTLLTARWRRNLPLEEGIARAIPLEEREVYRAVLALPRPYRTAIHLHCCEGYSVAEIAALTGAKEGTVKSWLSRGRARLAHALKGED
jgi:RNA polymerase sigma-70 factor (ECF subfamily)